MNNKIKKISIKSKITVAFLFLTMVATLLITGLSLHLSKENVFAHLIGLIKAAVIFPRGHLFLRYLLFPDTVLEKLQSRRHRVPTHKAGNIPLRSGSLYSNLGRDRYS